jgi:hypothetical protein
MELLDSATRAQNTEVAFMEMAVRMERARVADMKVRGCVVGTFAVPKTLCVSCDLRVSLSSVPAVRCT